jgi:outer membrane protein TolC
MVEGGYLWGSPAAVGNRKDLSVSQEIAFPTVYHHQKKLADLRDQQAEMTAGQYRLALMQEAAQLWVELVALNREIAVRQERAGQAKRLAAAYAERLATGEANRIDRNKAALNALQAEKALEALQQERELLQLSLNGFNAGQPLVVTQNSYGEIALPPDFDSWSNSLLQQNPQARWYRLEADAAGRSVKLNRSKNLPAISGGYMMENTVGEKFRGVTLGLTVPLWENKNSLKAARLRQESSLLEQQDFQLRFKTELHKLYRSVELASARVEDMRHRLESMKQEELLKDALDAGQISLIDYLLELQFNYNTADQFAEAEKELYLAWVKLKVLDM